MTYKLSDLFTKMFLTFYFLEASPKSPVLAPSIHLMRKEQYLIFKSCKRIIKTGIECKSHIEKKKK